MYGSRLSERPSPLDATSVDYHIWFFFGFFGGNAMADSFWPELPRQFAAFRRRLQAKRRASNVRRFTRGYRGVPDALPLVFEQFQYVCFGFMCRDYLLDDLDRLIEIRSELRDELCRRLSDLKFEKLERFVYYLSIDERHPVPFPGDEEALRSCCLYLAKHYEHATH